MRKMIFLAAAASLILAGAMTTAPNSAQAKSGCDARADALYPHNKNARKAYKNRCKANYRAWKKRHDKGIWIIL
jgi:hypothetical protein